MDLKQLQSLVSVAKRRSFSLAAEELFLSQPTVSNHIRLLEEELGCELFARTTKSLEITPVGEKVLEYAQNMLELQDRIRASCSAKENRIIHIGASTIPSAYILPELLAAYGRLRPEIYFSIHQSDSRRVIEEFEDGLYDIALVGEKHENANTVCVPVCQDHMVLIAPANEHYLSFVDREVFPLEQLKDEPIILREAGSGSLKFADNFLEKAGIREEDLHVVARANDQEAIKNLALQGLGISIVSEKAVEDLVREKRLLAFKLDGADEARSLYLIYKKKPSNEYVEDFAAFIRK